MNVLGLDFGQNFGWSVGAGGKVIRCGTADLQDRAKRLRCELVTAADHFVREKVVEYEISAIAWENSVQALRGSAMGFRKKRANVLTDEYGENRNVDLSKALIKHAGYEAVVQVIADKKDLRVVGPVPNVTLKKFATGSVKAKKSDMIRWANQLYSLDLRDDESDAADAAHVCAWAMQQINQPTW